MEFLKKLLTPAVLKALAALVTAIAAGYACGCQFKGHSEKLDIEAKPLEGIEFQTDQEPGESIVFPLENISEL